MSRTERIPITQDTIDVLIKHRDRTNVGPQALLRGKRQSMPSGLISSHIYGWIRGTIKTAPKPHLEFTMNEWAALLDVAPNQKRSGKSQAATYDELLPEQLLELGKYRDMGFLPGAVFKYYEDSPEDLRPNMVSGWLNGTIKTAQPDHITFVTQACAELEVHPQRPIIICDALYDELQSLKDQSGLGPVGLMKQANDIPGGLNIGILAGWFSRKSTTGRKDHLDFTRDWYRAFLERKEEATTI